MQLARKFLGAEAGQERFGLLFVFFMLACVVGCGSAREAEREDELPVARLHAVPMNTSYRPGSREVGEGPARVPKGSARAGESEMQVELEVGAIDQGDVESAIERNWHTLARCYDRAGEAQRYVDGEVRLRFLLAANGSVSDVLVVDSQIGNYAVERCLVVESRRIRFSAPEGGKATTFEYPIRFRSTQEVAVVDWPFEMLRNEIVPLMEGMEPCPGLGAEAIEAVAYILSDGTVGSVGLASKAAIDIEGGMCAVEQIRAWRLRSETGRVVRTSFRLHVPTEKRVVLAPARTPAEPRAPTPAQPVQGNRPSPQQKRKR